MKPQVSPDGKFMAAGKDNLVSIYDIWNPEASVIKLLGHQSFVKSVSWSPDGKTLASTGTERESIILWSTRTWSPLVELPFPSKYVHFTKDGHYLITDGQQGLSVWAIEK